MKSAAIEIRYWTAGKGNHFPKPSHETTLLSSQNPKLASSGNLKPFLLINNPSQLCRPCRQGQSRRMAGIVGSDYLMEVFRFCINTLFIESFPLNITHYCYKTSPQVNWRSKSGFWQNLMSCSKVCWVHKANQLSLLGTHLKASDPNGVRFALIRLKAAENHLTYSHCVRACVCVILTLYPHGLLSFLRKRFCVIAILCLLRFTTNTGGAGRSSDIQMVK